MATVALSGIITPTNVVTATSTTTLSNKTLVAPALGTPVSGNLSNCTGIPSPSAATPTVLGTVYGKQTTSGGTPFLTAYGYNAGLNTTGTNNTAVGVDSLKTNTTAGNNTSVGYQALFSSTTAGNNVAVGCEAGKATTTGDSNVFVGAQAGDANTTGINNTIIGKNAAGASTTASYNTVIGQDAMKVSTTAGENTVIGHNAGAAMTTAARATIIGLSAAGALTTGGQNTLIGYSVAGPLVSGGFNVIIGEDAGDGITTDGAGNTIVGFSAGTSNVTTNCCILGRDSRPSSGSREHIFGSNVIGMGNDTIAIGASTGKVYNSFSSNATWTQTSDVRLKTNIQDDSLGLSFINRLRPVKFNWKPSNEIDPSLPLYNEVNERNTTTVIHGLIAQEVKSALDAEGVSTFAGWDLGNDGIQAISREMFISPLIKAIQEQQAIIESLKARLDAANI